MVIMGRYLIGTCNIGNAMNSKKYLGTDENGNGKMARTIDVCDYILLGCLDYQNVLLQSLHWKFSSLYSAILCGISNH